METVGYNSNPLTYNGNFISAFDDGSFSDLIPDCIIKRNAGVSMRPALATKYSAGMETATPTDIHFANAFSSPYLYKKKVNFNTCTILPVTTGSSSTELGSAVYYNYPPSSTDYIYFHLNSSGEYDLTNAGCNVYDRYPYTPGDSEVIRLKFLGQSTGPSFNLSDFTAVRNFEMPNLTGNIDHNEGGLKGIFQHEGWVEDGDTNNVTKVHVMYPSGVVKELENFYAPLDDGGYDTWGVGWEAISSVKNVRFAGYAQGAVVGEDGFLPSIKYIENLTAVSAEPGRLSASGVTVRGTNCVNFTLSNSDIDGANSGLIGFTGSIINGELTSKRDESPYGRFYKIDSCVLGTNRPLHITTDHQVHSGNTYPPSQVPAGTYNWNEASGFSAYWQGGYQAFFVNCTGGNVTFTVE